MKNLQDETIHTLEQLEHFLNLIPESDYSCELPVLHGNSIGKHIRHIIEFYDTLLESSSTTLNYDLRKRSFILENSRTEALSRIEEIKFSVDKISNDRSLLIEGDYSETGNDRSLSTSSLSRELAYNLEHIVHHMAIMRIAFEAVHPTVQL
ncbi:MAG: hypothetical protein ACPF9D_14470, partial [Owenweeksia sp.]